MSCLLWREVLFVSMVEVSAQNDKVFSLKFNQMS